MEENNGKKNSLIIGVVVCICIAVIVGGFLLTKTLNNNKNAGILNENIENQNINELIGKWEVYRNGQIQEGNYFLFNSDGTFAYASSNSGIATGNYTYEYGVDLREGGKKYKDGDYTLYYVLLIPTSITKKDGTIITEGLNQMEYAIGVNGTEMNSQNLLSRNTTTLKKVD